MPAGDGKAALQEPAASGLVSDVHGCRRLHSSKRRRVVAEARHIRAAKPLRDDLLSGRQVAADLAPLRHPAEAIGGWAGPLGRMERVVRSDSYGSGVLRNETLSA